MPSIQFVVKIGRKYSTIYAPDGKTVYVELERTAGNVIICSFINERAFDGWYFHSASSGNMIAAINEAMNSARDLMQSKTPR
jgi:hypothetical protein